MRNLLIFTFLGLIGITSRAQSGLFLNAVSSGTPTPSLTVTGTFSAFTTTSGTPSTAQTVTVSGANLTAGCTVTAPTGFEVSLDNSSYGSSKSITQSGTGLASQPVTVYTRLAAADAAGSYSGNVAFASAGATTQNVAASGTVSSGGGGRTSHYRLITIPNSNITGGSNLDSFTVSWSDTATYLKTLSQGGEIKSVVSGKPADLLFGADNLAATKYKWDVESWDSIAGTITCHVLIPTGVSASANTLFYVVYDSAGIASYQGGTNPYDSKTAAVYYFNETLSGSSAQTVHDYTGNGHNMTSSGSWTTGQQAAGAVGGSLSLLKASSNFFTMTTQTYSSTYTIEGWYRSPGTPDLTDNWWLMSNDESTLMGTNGVFEFFNNCGNAADVTTFNTNTWYYIVFTRTGTTSICYHNGVPQTAQTTGCNVTFDGMATGFGGSDVSQDDLADDIRISTVVRTAGWIAAKYLNQHSPKAFYTVGSEN